MIIDVPCPHCKAIKKIPVTSYVVLEPTVQWCNEEEGGCGQLFIVKLEFIPNLKTYQISEEGENVE